MTEREIQIYPEPEKTYFFEREDEGEVETPVSALLLLQLALLSGGEGYED